MHGRGGGRSRLVFVVVAGKLDFKFWHVRSLIGKRPPARDPREELEPAVRGKLHFVTQHIHKEYGKLRGLALEAPL